MAEKKPMSLNERHQRFLASQNRSARPSSTLTGEKNNPHLQNSNLEGRRRLFKPSSNDFVNQNEPNFSGIMDFDSPPLKSDAPNFQGIMDFDSPPSKSTNVSDDAPSFRGIMDFDSPPAIVEEETSCSESVDCDDSSAVDSKDSKKISSSKVVEEKFSEYESGLEDSDTYTEEDIGGDDDENNQKLAYGTDDDSSPTNVSSLGQEVVSQSEKDENENEDESYVYRFKSSAVDSKDLKKNPSSKVVEEKFSEVESGFEDSDTYTEEDIGGDDENNLKLADGSDDDSLPTNAPSLGQELVSQSGNSEDGNEDDSYVYHFKSSRTPEEEKPQKVKLEGRRRLCKASVKEDRAGCRVEVDQHEYSEIADFSPPSRNVYIPPDKPGVSGVVELDTPPEKIRDILDDLSSKLEFMSIEKKPNKRVVKVPDSALSKLMEHYDSPGSSSLLSPDPSVISPDVSVKPWTQGAIKEVESDKFFDAVDYVKEEVDEVHKIEKKDYGVTKSVKEHGVTKSEKKDYGFLKSEKKDYGFLKSEKKDYGVIKSEKKAYSVKKIEKSVSKDKYLVVSDDDEDPYTVLSSTNRQSSSRVYLPKEHDTICVDTPKQLGGGDWVFEDGESIILTGKRSNYTLPGKIAKMLYPHQRQGLRWLWSLHCKGTGGILGDDMGLGKTMQMCSFIAGLFHSRLIKRVLVVAPKTLLSHWIKELTVVGLSAKIREYYGSCAKARQYELQYIFQDSGILLTTYDIVRNNYKSLRGDSFFLDEAGEDCITWDYTILDEGHIIKNPSTQRAKSLLEIPCCHRIIISGTPIQNNLKELWALFSFCCPELLGDKKEFKLKYESAILRLNDKNATDREKRIGSTVAKDLRERIEPYFLRRLKSEVFLEEDSTKTSKISKKHELIVWLKLTQCQRQLYEAFLNSELVLSSFDKSPLAAITILKKICDHPYLLTKRAAEEVLEGMETMVNQEELGILEKMAHQLANATDREHFQDLIDNVSCKIAFMLPLLDNLILEGHHVLIFSQTRKMLNFVQEAVISKGYNFLRIDGTTKMTDREKIVKDFQEGKGAPIFLLTSAVGGLGLTLTKADRVIVVDPAWNPSTDNQSVDRAYRIGQMKDVIVYRLMTCGTIEEKIYKMQVFKGGLFKTATENKEQTKYFSQRDLRELFSLPKEGFDVSVTQRQLEEEHGQHHTMSDSLKEEIEFLESHDIGGVSHHSLLYSKSAPAPEPVPEENEVIRRKEYTYVGGSSSVRNVERNVDGAEFAFNPKEVKTVSSKNTSSVTPNKLSESEIRDRIERLNQMYGNKAMISRLPDKGEKLKRQIADLSKELEQINMVESSEIIDLDEISGKLQRVHV